MGKTKTKFNWKSRQIVKTTIDKTDEKKIKVDIKDDGHYDEANPLVLPAKKRKTVVEKPKLSNVKFLSKKKRKQLEKIVERKKKRENRDSLIEELTKVQATPEELKRMVSISAAQTKGLKRRYGDEGIGLEVVEAPESRDAEAENGIVINSIKGARKRRRLMAVVNSLDQEKKKERNLNVVGFDSSSSESSEEEEESELKEEEESELKEEDESKEEENVDGAEINGEEDGESTVKEETEGDLPEANAGGDAAKAVPAAAPAPRVPAVYVPVNRVPEIQEARLKLPILTEEQLIMETISENAVTIIAGETGSGKTTQVPQFLYEAGYTNDGRMIGITEPRRVAAISMAKRVGEELNLPSEVVSYLIRFEGNVTTKTKIKFMTDGVLLKEMATDFLLSKYRVIILDEAHERSVYSDILMGLLSRVVALRKKRNDPLKLIIMSATLRVQDFTDNRSLFSVPPPVVKVDARQFPVTVHFNRRTNPDYLREAYRKACKIHTQLPEGGILIFLTGQQEVNHLVTKLRKAFPYKIKDWKVNEKKQKNDEEGRSSDEDVELDLNNALQRIRKKKKEKKIVLPEVSLDDYDIAPEDDTEMDLLDSDDEDLGGDDWEEEVNTATAQPLWVLPLYSVLPSREQAKVFQGAPEGCRLCVVATNVAETSLTIPGVKYVVDSGKVKVKLYDKSTGVSTFRVLWASKAAADQRAGRAGRTSPGHCYRLYSSAVFNDEFEEWSEPEIRRRPVDDLVLQMKALGIEKVVNFPYPTPPDIVQLKAAEQRLVYLGALTKKPQISGKKGDLWTAKLTPLGEAMSRFPVAPRFSKMLCLSHQHNLLQYTVALVAALSIQELLLTVEDNDKSTKTRRLAWAGQGNFKLLGDAMVLLRAIGGAEYANSRGKLEEFCSEHRIRLKGLIEARKIRLQLTNEINLSNPGLSLSVDPAMPPPSDVQAKLLRQIVLSGMIDQVGRKVDVPEGEETSSAKRRPLYHTALLEDSAQLHSSSVLYRDYPDWVVFQEIYESNKIYLRGITAIEAEWLPKFAPLLCRLGTPLEDPPPRYDPSTELIHCWVKGTFGRRGWSLPEIETEFPEGLEKYKWFAMYFLDGTIFPRLLKFTKNLLSTPKTMIRNWARLQPRTEYFIKTLVSKEVDTKKKLLEVWETEPTYLLAAYQQWLPDTFHNEVAMGWPPVGLLSAPVD